MVDWLTYKGQNPWTCVALHDKVEYNEGSYVAKSPEVFGGTPIWKVGKTGPAITDTHVPCGYWFKDYREYIPAPAPPVTEYYFIHNFETAVGQPDFWGMEEPGDYLLYYENTVLDPDAKFGNYACSRGEMESYCEMWLYYEPDSTTDEFWPPLTYEFWFKASVIDEYLYGEHLYGEIWLYGWLGRPEVGYPTDIWFDMRFWVTPASTYMEDNVSDMYFNYISGSRYDIPFPLGEYVHYALVVLPDRIKVFYNGVLFKEYISPQANGFNVMYTDFYLYSEYGKILMDALSIAKGEKYTENFTPPTKPPSK